MEPNYPEIDEFVIGKVVKVLPFGAVITLDEYQNAEAFVHISEVSSGWVKNIREYIKEGQVVVAKVLRLDPIKHQIDVSTKRVSEADKKRKIQHYQSVKRAIKMFEHVAVKLTKPLNLAYTEAGDAILKEYGDFYTFFESLAAGEEIKAKIPKAWATALTESAKAEIKEKKAVARLLLTLQSHAPDGLEKIKSVLAEVAALQLPSKLTIHYVSAPHYFLDLVAPDFKTIDKTQTKLDAFLTEKAKQMTFELTREEKK